MSWMKHRIFKYFSLIILISFAVGFTLKLSNPITLVIQDDGRDYQLITSARDMASLMKEGSLQVGSHDRLNVPKEAKLYDGMKIVIERARKVTISHGDVTSLVYTHAHSVREALDQAAITLSPTDRVLPGPKSPVVNDMQITVQYVTVKEEIENKAIAYNIVYRDDPNLEEGQELVLQEGQEGVLRSRHLLYYEGEHLIEEVYEDEQYVKQPVDKIVARGSFVSDVVVSRGDSGTASTPAADQPTAKPAPQEPAPKEPPAPVSFIMEATAYNDIGTTASGVPSGPGKVAVDPSIIPLGTKLLIESMDGWESYGYAVAADTGGAIIGYRIDLFYYDHQTCIDFGRRQVRVTIVE